MSEENRELEQGGEEILADAGAAGETEKKKDSLESTVYCWAQAVVTAVVGVILLFTFGVRLISVSGPSMQDTLYTGDRLLVLNAMFCGFKAGDVVVINDYNAELDDTLVKRIVAVGGQTVDMDFSTGEVYVDGQVLDEPYIKEPTYTPEGVAFPLTLAEDEVFVMGDNRNHSTDSRDTRLGPVKVGYLQGKALLLLTPGETPDTGKSDWSRVGVIH
jgi:signal peptidase I